MTPMKTVVLLPLFFSIFVPVKTQVCQRCDQTITGRNFNYAAALEIIQDEEYLEEADFDDIRRYRFRRNTNSHLNNTKLGVILKSFYDKCNKKFRVLRQCTMENININD